MRSTTAAPADNRNNGATLGSLLAENIRREAIRAESLIGMGLRGIEWVNLGRGRQENL
jgi:hypothetical protein